MNKIIESLSRLGKYFYLSQFHKEPPASDLLSSNDALRDFGKLWSERQNDVLMMLAWVEYQYTTEKKVYSEKDIAAVKNTLALVTKFLRMASEEKEKN